MEMFAYSSNLGFRPIPRRLRNFGRFGQLDLLNDLVPVVKNLAISEIQNPALQGMVSSISTAINVGTAATPAAAATIGAGVMPIMMVGAFVFGWISAVLDQGISKATKEAWAQEADINQRAASRRMNYINPIANKAQVLGFDFNAPPLPTQPTPTVSQVIVVAQGKPLPIVREINSDSGTPWKQNPVGFEDGVYNIIIALGYIPYPCPTLISPNYWGAYTQSESINMANLYLSASGGMTTGGFQTIFQNAAAVEVAAIINSAIASGKIVGGSLVLPGVTLDGNAPPQNISQLVDLMVDLGSRTPEVPVIPATVPIVSTPAVPSVTPSSVVAPTTESGLVNVSTPVVAPTPVVPFVISPLLILGLLGGGLLILGTRERKGK